MKFSSLRSRLVFLLFVWFVLPFAVVGGFIWKQVNQESKKEFERQVRVGKNAVQVLIEQVQVAKIDAQSLIQDIVALPYQFTPDNIEFQGGLAYLSRISPFDRILLLDEDQKELFHFIRENTSTKGENNEGLIKRAYENQLGTALVPGEREMWIELAAPLQVGQGLEKKRVLFAKKPINANLLDHLKEITGNDFSLLFEQKHRLTTLINPQSERDSGNSFSFKEGIQTEFMAERNIFGRDYMVILQPLPEALKFPGVLGHFLPIELVSKTPKLLKKYGLGLMGFAIFMTLMLGVVISRQVTRPIIEMSQSAIAISKGDFQQILPVRSQDELGQLAGTFNMMTRKLNRKMFETETLFDVSRSMNFMNNSDQLLNLILDKALYALDAERGSIMLYERRSGGLEVKMVRSRYEGESEERPSHVVIKPGEGIAGRVFEMGETIISSGFNDERYSKKGVDQKIVSQSEGETNRKVHSLICCPLMAKEKPIGIINITNKLGDGNFDDSDAGLLEALASQAAITLENARLYELSITDGLTGLFIKRYFQFRLEEELNRAGRYDNSVSLILFDIDHFKKFNDNYGHQVGDMVLIHFSNLVKKTIRLNIDIPCRYGGEEFAVICPETSAENALPIAERLRMAIEEFDFPGVEGQKLKVTTSLGISSFPGLSKGATQLIEQADIALYACKAAGRNCSKIFTPKGEENIS